MKKKRCVDCGKVRFCVKCDTCLRNLCGGCSTDKIICLQCDMFNSKLERKIELSIGRVTGQIVEEDLVCIIMDVFKINKRFHNKCKKYKDQLKRSKARLWMKEETKQRVVVILKVWLGNSIDIKRAMKGFKSAFE